MPWQEWATGEPLPGAVLGKTAQKPLGSKNFLQRLQDCLRSTLMPRSVPGPGARGSPGPHGKDYQEPLTACRGHRVQDRVPKSPPCVGEEAVDGAGNPGGQGCTGPPQSQGPADPPCERPASCPYSA
ncbi:hypothetical protein AAY473_012863 [Plecturocebus cupreus]